MTEEMAFMKNWDLITPYFLNYHFSKFRDQTDDNWFLKRCSSALSRDYET